MAYPAGAIITPLTLNSPKFDNDITMNGLKSLDTNKKLKMNLGKIVRKLRLELYLKVMPIMALLNPKLQKILNLH